MPDAKPFAEQVEGPVKATGSLSQTPDGWRIRTDATGPYDLTAAVEGLVSPAIDIRFDLSVPDLPPLAPQVRGPLKATGTLRQTDAGFVVDTEATGPYGAKALVAGLATGPDMSLNFNLSVPNVNPLLPGVNGPLSANGKVYQTPEGLAVDTQASGPYSARATVTGVVTGANAAVDYTLAMPNLAAIVPQLNGPLDVDGSARRQGGAWQINTAARGPGGTQASVSGQVAENGTLNLDIAGTAPLGLSKPFIEPRSLQGQARFDLTVNGPRAVFCLWPDHDNGRDLERAKPAHRA
ncbi:hypothetical protein ACFQFQ_14450 [Sulfitobacter porphyrae]|uniref:DUF3971 domain-containing protein n=1 Tax=Sulfitobacter porphyrae TaxID=1246864 RepID=A0ABW2B3V7_9RHOB